MRLMKMALAAGLLVTCPLLVQAQSPQLRGLSQPGVMRLPSAQQQLNRQLDRQRSDMSFQRRLEGNNRLNRTDQINRLNTRPSTACPSANAACRDNR